MLVNGGPRGVAGGGALQLIPDARNRGLAYSLRWTSGGAGRPVAVAALFVVVILRAGGTYAGGRATGEEPDGAGSLVRCPSLGLPGCSRWSPGGERRW